jgi:hypothetical protein
MHSYARTPSSGQTGKAWRDSCQDVLSVSIFRSSPKNQIALAER